MTLAPEMKAVAQSFRVLGDLNRLRLLRLLRRERLNVTELTALLGVSQSGVSRHLKMLRDAGLVEEHREGSWAYFQVPGEPTGVAGRLLDAFRSAIEYAPDSEGDMARLEEVLRERRERSSAPFSAREGVAVPGRSWRAWSMALLRLIPPLRVADIGCGDAALTLELARAAREVIAIDRSPEVLERARARVSAAGARNVRLLEGELERIPLENEHVDLALLSQALHHAASPPSAVREAARVLRPGGRLIVLDLAPHAEEWVRDKLGDLWLGFGEERLREMCEAAGLADIDTTLVPRPRGAAFGITITHARKPGASREHR